MLRTTAAGYACGEAEIPYEDLNSLADAVAESAKIYLDGRLVWLREGTLVQVTMDALREIIAKNVVTQRLVQRGNGWELVYSPFEPSPKELRVLLTADLKTGSLIARVMTA